MPSQCTPCLTTLDDLDANQPGLVLLVIMDTLRLNCTHVCGHDKPNTPVLDAMTKTSATASVVPQPRQRHGPPESCQLLYGRSHVRAWGTHPWNSLGDEFETLAEIYAERGYQTAFLSANPSSARLRVGSGRDLIRSSV